MENNQTKKIKVCPYYSPRKILCANHNHPKFNENNDVMSKYLKCELKGRYWECNIVDKLIELTLDKNNFVVDKNEIPYKIEDKQ